MTQRTLLFYLSGYQWLSSVLHLDTLVWVELFSYKMNSLNVNTFISLFYRSCYFLYVSQVRWENKKLGIAYAISLLLAPAYIIFKIYEVLIINTFNIPKIVNILLIPKILMNYRLYICKNLDINIATEYIDNKEGYSYRTFLLYFYILVGWWIREDIRHTTTKYNHCCSADALHSPVWYNIFLRSIYSNNSCNNGNLFL